MLLFANVLRFLIFFIEKNQNTGDVKLVTILSIAIIVALIALIIVIIKINNNENRIHEIKKQINKK